MPQTIQPISEKSKQLRTITNLLYKLTSSMNWTPELTPKKQLIKAAMMILEEVQKDL